MDYNIVLDTWHQMLRKPASAADVIAFTGGRARKVVTYENIGYIKVPDFGVSIMFTKAPYLIGIEGESESLKDMMIVSALHFHAPGTAKGYAEYRGEILGGVRFGDTEADIIAKAGEPELTGCLGGASPGAPVNRWLRYRYRGDRYHFQLSPEGRMDLATMIAETSPAAVPEDPPLTWYDR